MSPPAPADDVASTAAETALQQETHMELNEHDQESDDERTPHGNWIDVVSKWNRRKNKNRPQGDHAELHPAATTAQGKMAEKPRASPKPPPLPKDDFKMIIRPTDGLDLRKYQAATISDSILNAAQLSWKEASIKIRIDYDQNIATVSTPHELAARKLDKITQLNVQGTCFRINHYGLFPQNSSKGVLHDIPSHCNPQEILDDLWMPGYEFAACRRLGQSGSVVITILGSRVPFYVYYKGVETRCYLYKKTLPYCFKCFKQGHRSDVCPTPDVIACERCGAHDPPPNHLCNPKCDLCQGDHLTASKECRMRFREPYLLRRKKWERDHSSTQPESTHRSRSVTRGNSVPAGRSNSRSSVRLQGRRSRSRSKSKHLVEKRERHGNDTERNQVSWASLLSPTAPPPRTQCSECDKLQEEIKTLRTEIQSLKALMTQQLKKTPEPTPQTQPATLPKAALEPPMAPFTQTEIDKKRRREQAPPMQEENGPSYITKEEFQSSLQQFTTLVQDQLKSISAQLGQVGSQVAQLSAQMQSTQTRIERLELQHPIGTARHPRREKPYLRPGQTDTTAESYASNQDD